MTRRYRPRRPRPHPGRPPTGPHSSSARSHAGRATRAVWLAAVALSVASPARLLDPRLPAQAVQIVRAMAPSGRVPRGEEGDNIARGRAEPSINDAPDPRADSRLGPVPPEAPGVMVSAHTGSLPDSVPEALKPEADRTGEPRVPSDEPRRPTPGASAVEDSRAVRVRDPFDAEPTAHAGLWFLIPALERLGIAGYLQGYPDAAANDWPRQLLHAVGSRLGIGEPDAARRSLGESGVSAVWEPDAFAVPTGWIGAITTRGRWQVGWVNGVRRVGRPLRASADRRVEGACSPGRSCPRRGAVAGTGSPGGARLSITVADPRLHRPGLGRGPPPMGAAVRPPGARGADRPSGENRLVADACGRDNDAGRRRHPRPARGARPRLRLGCLARASRPVPLRAGGLNP